MKPRCLVRGCKTAAVPAEDMPKELAQLGATLCESHLEVVQGSIKDAVAESESLKIPTMVDLISYYELLNLLHPVGNPRLRLVQ